MNLGSGFPAVFGGPAGDLRYRGNHTPGKEASAAGSHIRAPKVRTMAFICIGLVVMGNNTRGDFRGWVLRDA